MKSLLSHLECSACNKRHDADKAINLCDCGASLLCRYDLKPFDAHTNRRDLWRYFEVLPVRHPDNVVSLGEGGTPLVEAPRLAKMVGIRKLWIKDEGTNPTGSFKARGMAVAIARAHELGVRRVCLPTAGNAGGAAATYASAYGMEAHVFMPKTAPASNIKEVSLAGAKVYFVDGLIDAAAREMQKYREQLGLYDVSTLKEPYRVEGKKIMAYELFDQFGGKFPDVFMFPTGGGTGVIGMWKAFQEMRELGWLKSEKLPRIVVVQAAGCAPVVQAYMGGQDRCEPWPEPKTFANGLAVPKPFADRLILQAIKESRGAAIPVSDSEIKSAIAAVYSKTGVFPSPEGAACLPALRKILEANIMPDVDSAVMFNTATGLKYLELH